MTIARACFLFALVPLVACNQTTPQALPDTGLRLLDAQVGTRRDAGLADSGREDAGPTDTGVIDAGPADTGVIDTGPLDTGLVDTGPTDTGVIDTGPTDTGSLPYPTRSTYRLKGLQPDFWADPAEVANANTGGVAMNLVWAFWEPTLSSPPCASTQVEYDGHCFVIDAAVDNAIRDWTNRGVVVTAVVYGVPTWARITTGCSPIGPGFDIFCAPVNAADYGRFAGMIATRYNGLQGHGRIADFVIHNEVNANDWFDIGCGDGTTCDTNAWIQTYADNWNAAYDQIIAAQPPAKVLVSLEHHFGATFDDPGASHPLLSGETFLRGFAARVGNRAWRVAYHPYPPDLLLPDFSADDWPRITYGNVGTIVGWLRKNFPNTPSAWQVQLTESGVNSLGASSQAAQAQGVCDSLYNVVATPGIESYIYHRMVDHPAETVNGLGVGLHDVNRQPKAAWAVWALANRNDLSPSQLSCGFEKLPFIHLKRGNANDRGHWATSRRLPPGFAQEGAGWGLLREPAPGLQLLYSCLAGLHNILTLDPNCEGLHPMGPVGYAATNPVVGTTIPLHRCRVASSGDHFVSSDANCEGQTLESVLGHVIAY